MDKPFQRKGAKSNSHVGREFEIKCQNSFARKGMILTRGFQIEIGINGKKLHEFDLGSEKDNVLVECKAHTWTEGGNVPSAKLTVWNEAMYLFYSAPKKYTKILFVKRDFSPKKQETLGQYYVRTDAHLIPKDVQLWEYDESKDTAERII